MTVILILLLVLDLLYLLVRLASVYNNPTDSGEDVLGAGLLFIAIIAILCAKRK